MKGDCALEDLQYQWPHGVGILNFKYSLLDLHGALVKEPTMERNKFGFVMKRYWGDLQSLIDLRMEYKNAKGPPFSLPQAKYMMDYIAQDMSDLHKKGWWRAPEILLQLKNGTPSSKLEFNEKVDVYSFAMTCYEIATRLLPFEGHPSCSKLRDAILNGARLELPHDLDLEIRAIITSCWDPNPLLRPRFGELI